MQGKLLFGFLGLWGIVTITLLTHCSSADKGPEIFSFSPDQLIQLDRSMDSIFEHHGLMGMATCLFIDTNLIYTRYKGLIHEEKQIRLDEQSLFRIASISKTVTAIAAMQLVDLELLDLHRDVSRYLGWELRHPKFPDDSITLFQLLNHRTGIRDGTGYSQFVNAMQEQSVRIRDLFRVGGRFYTVDMFTDHRPGSFFSYSNCAWGLVASIIEIVSGERFDQYCKNHIFHPLKMDANFNVGRIKDLDRLSVLYRYQDSTWVPQADKFDDKPLKPQVPVSYRFGQNGLLFGPQGSLRCSAIDLTKLASVLINGGEYGGRRVLSAQSTQTMITPHWQYNGSNGDTWDQFFLSYGLGVHRLTGQPGADVIFPGVNLIGHPGIAYGLLSDMYVDPASKLGVVFVTNGSMKGYVYGRNSTFYQVEEDIFSTLNRFAEPLLVDFTSHDLSR